MPKTKYPQFHGIIDIPEGKSGDFEIKHDNRPAGTRMPLANTRTIILGGDKPVTLKYEYPTRWHELLEDGSRWMSDWPIEQQQMLTAVKPIKSGRVLIGGLGLGVIATWIAKRPHVTQVTVVELSQDVINLVGPHLLKDDPDAKAKLDIVQGDLLEYIKNLPVDNPSFEWAFYDIWASDGESTFFFVVCPLIEASHKRVKNRTINWNENVMRGQLISSLHGRYTFATKYRDAFPEASKDIPTVEQLATPGDSIWKNWAVPFFQWVLKYNPSYEEVERHIGYYSTNYGQPGFMENWRRIKHLEK